MDSDKGSNEGMIFFRVELLRLRDLVRAVGLSLLRLEGLSEKKIEKIQIKIRIKFFQQFNRSNKIPES